MAKDFGQYTANSRPKKPTAKGTAPHVLRKTRRMSMSEADLQERAAHRRLTRQKRNSR